MYEGKSIWVANEGDRSLTRHSLHDSEIIQTVELDVRPVSLLVERPNIWDGTHDDGVILNIKR